MSYTRRRFLGFAAGATAGAMLSRKGGRYLAELAGQMDLPLYPPGGEESFRLSICRECPGGCGVRVRCIGERAVKVDGNPLHPVSAGRLCARGQAMLQSLYHPDRILQPLRRTGPRGSLASFQPASWEEALKEIAVRLTLLRDQSRPEALVVLRQAGSGIASRLAARFMTAFGSPNDIVSEQGAGAARLALQLTQGVAAEPAYDIAEAEYILSVGSSVLEVSGSPVYNMRAFGAFRRGRNGRRGRLVHVGPRLSLTGIAADEWVPVRPGSEAVFALGMASVLIEEGLYDKSFVALHAAGFEDGSGNSGAAEVGLRHFLAREFSLERVAAECQVSVNHILRLAREFAAARPGLAVGPRTGLILGGDLYGHLACQVLNGLVGNIDGPGGMLVPEAMPPSGWPAIAEDAVAARGRRQPRLDRGGRAAAAAGDPERLAETVLAGDPYVADAALVLDGDPVFTAVSPGALGAALEHIPLVVSMALIPTETSLMSDWILPVAHALECWDLDYGPPGIPYPVATLARPVLQRPAGAARPTAEVLLELAHRLGGAVAAAMPWPDVATAIREDIRGLYAARRGTILGTPFDEAWVRLMERAGWWAPGYQTEEELWQKMQETGGWWDPFYDHWDWRRALTTPSGRFEFHAGTLARIDRERRVRQAAWPRTGREEDGRTTTTELALHLFEPLSLAGASGASLPYLQDILDPFLEARWETWLELHPETARQLGVDDGEEVVVSHALSSIQGRIRLTERVVPGAVAIPVGQGRHAGGRWARNRGANPLTLVAPVRETVSGLPDIAAIRVRLVSASEAMRQSEEGV